MKMCKWMACLTAIAAFNSQLAMRSHAGLFKIDFAANQNDADGVTLTDWDVIATWTFADFSDGVAKWKLKDFSSDGDSDVTLTIKDNEALSLANGWDPPSGQTGNNPTHENVEVVYDGVTVPAVVKDDYIYRNPDTAGAELLYMFSNLNPGKYNVTVFEGRTSDGNGEFGKIWVDDANGKNEPAEANTGDFSGTHLEDGARVQDPQGNPKTLTLDIAAGQYLWFAHMEDNSGGVSGIIIRSLAPIVDTDADGIPDDWEKQYGLNPNDPADAKLDCNKNGVTNLDEYKANLDPCDATPPAVTAAVGSGTMDTIKLTFSETLELTGATNAANYSISPTLPITGVSYKNKEVTLTTGKQTAGATYTVSLKGIKDLSKNEVPAGTTATVHAYVMGRTGVLKFSYWGDATGGDPISGTAIQGLLDDPRYPASPSIVLPVYSFTSRDAFPNDTHENYGATIEGYLTPKETAKYRFFLSSDDASQLWLSTDDKEANLAQIAEETGCCNAFTEPDSPRTSEPISLTAGKNYFIRLFYKEGGGGDYGLVAWRKDGDTTAANKLKPIAGEFLSSTIDLPIPPVPSADPSTLAKGLTAYWTFDSNLYEAVQGLNGVAKGKTAISFVDGKAGFGKSLKLDGTNYVEIPNSKTALQFAKGDLSIAGWFKVDAFDKSWQALIAKGEDLNYRIARRSDGVVTGDPQIAYAGGVGEGPANAPKVNDGAWHHFVAVTDSTGVKFGTALYVDGAVYSVNTNKAVLAAGTSNLLIGENPGATGRQWKGEIDDVGLWNRVLSADEVALLYNSGTGTPVSTLPGVSAPIVLSTSRNGNSLTIQWSGSGGTLESSPTLSPANWTTVGTANPATITLGGQNAYYRIKK